MTLEHAIEARQRMAVFWRAVGFEQHALAVEADIARLRERFGGQPKNDEGAAAAAR